MKSNKQLLINEVVDYVQTIAFFMGIGEVIVADEDFDENIPSGVTFIFPKGTVQLDPKWMPNFDFDENHNIILTNIPHVWILLPEAVFRVDDKGVTCASASCIHPWK